MSKLIWETSSLKPTSWWQLHLGNGLIPISIQYREQTFAFWVGNTKIQVFKRIGYHTEVGKGLSARQNILPTLQEAKDWGIQTAKDALQEMSIELKPEVPWLLWGCLISAIALASVWLLLFN